jgi:hypothetical protein
MVVTFNVVVVWVMKVHSPVSWYQHLGRTHCLHLQCYRYRQCVSQKLWYSPSRVHTITTLKIKIQYAALLLLTMYTSVSR